MLLCQICHQRRSYIEAIFSITERRCPQRRQRRRRHRRRLRRQRSPQRRPRKSRRLRNRRSLQGRSLPERKLLPEARAVLKQPAFYWSPPAFWQESSIPALVDVASRLIELAAQGASGGRASRAFSSLSIHTYHEIPG